MTDLRKEVEGIIDNHVGYMGRRNGYPREPEGIFTCTKELLSLIKQECFKARIDEVKELLGTYFSCNSPDEPLTVEYFFDEVTRKHSEVRIEQLQSQLTKED